MTSTTELLWTVSAWLFWLALLLLVGTMVHAHWRRGGPPPWRSAPLLASIVGAAHHGVGSLPAVGLLRFLGSTGFRDVSQGEVLVRLLWRPAAQPFEFHHFMAHPMFTPWRLLTQLPLEPAIVSISTLESLLVAGVVLASATALRQRGDGTDESRHPYRSAAFAGTMAGVVAGGLHFAAQVQAVQPWGSLTPIELELALVAPVGALAFSTPIITAMAVAAVASRARRRRGLKAIALLLTFWSVVAAFVAGASELRRNAFAEIPGRSAALVEALETYVRESGHGPGQLSDLVPRHIAAIPRTGMGAYPDYHLMNFGGSLPWVLNVPCPTGYPSFETLSCTPPRKDFYTESRSRPLGGWWYHAW